MEIYALTAAVTGAAVAVGAAAVVLVAIGAIEIVTPTERQADEAIDRAAVDVVQP